MTEYPSIERRIRLLQTAPHGTKRKRAERLQKARTATLKRENAMRGKGTR